MKKEKNINKSNNNAAENKPERKKVFRWYWVWDFEKEEVWLNEMAAAGWALYKVGYCMYYFEKCEPDEYTVRLEMRDYDPAYISFTEETGAEYIGRVMKWIYFRKKAEYGGFELFSDIDSRISHLGRIAALLRVLAYMNLFIGIFNSLLGNGRFAWANLAVACLLMYGLGRITGKKDDLQTERKLRE